MKNTILLFLLILLAFPTLSIGAEKHTLAIEFSFNAPADQGKKVKGYRLYKEGKQVCQTTKPTASKMECQLLMEEDTTNFTLAAYYSNNTESPQSAPFPFTINTQAFNFKWTFKDSAKNARGFRIYDNGILLSEISNSSSRQLSYKVATTTSKHKFSISAVDAKGKETTLANSALSYSINTTPTAVLSSSTAAGKAPLTVKFDGSASTTPNTPIVSYNWVFGDGAKATGKTTSHVFTKTGTYYTKLTVKDSKGLTDTVDTPIVVTTVQSANNVSAGNKTSTSLNLEMGEVSVDHEWVRVLYKNTFNNPIIVAGPPTFNGDQAVLVRVRNIDKKGFEIRLQEWDYLDGRHDKETFSYIVMEKGTFSLNDGTKIEAGTFSSSNQFKKVTLQQSYNLNPIILTQVMTNKDKAAVIGRVTNINQSSFQCKLQEQEKNSASHATETIGYIAWEPGNGNISGLQYEVGTKSAQQNWSNLTFKTGFSTPPFFIAGMQTFNGSDPAAVRLQSISKTATKIKIEEETSKDAEVEHATENVGYLTVNSAKE